MRLCSGKNCGLKQIFEICNLETLAILMRSCSSNCDRFNITLVGLVSIRPWLLMKTIEYIEGKIVIWIMDDNDSWSLVQEGDDHLSLKINTFSICATSLCLYLLIWSLIILLACIFEYLNTSNLLMRCEKWILVEDHLRWRKIWLVQEEKNYNCPWQVSDTSCKGIWIVRGM